MLKLCGDLNNLQINHLIFKTTARSSHCDSIAFACPKDRDDNVVAMRLACERIEIEVPIDTNGALFLLILNWENGDVL